MLRFAPLLLLLLAGCALPGAPIGAPIYIARTTRALVESDLEGACRRYDAGHTDQPTLLACGKWMFFYETFGTSGVPASLPEFLIRAFPREIGRGFEKLGMIEDPRSRKHLPYGLAPGKLIGFAPSIAYTCASCHVARLPDGRIAIGAPNHRYQYGHQILAMTLFPFVATGGPKGHADEAVAVIQPLLDRLKADPRIWMNLGAALIKAMAAFKIPLLTPEVERAYASWPAGTHDFVIQPLAVDDKVEIVGKIPALFELPREEEIASSHMVHAMYGWSGNAHSLVSFLRGFISLGGGNPDHWSEAKLRPLIEYVYSLPTPKNPDVAGTASLALGKALFRDKGCLDCHSGPRHSGKRIYKPEEIGTDPSLVQWLDPEGKGAPCCDAKVVDPLTRGIKSPRLNGLWTQRRFLHNGALSSLEQLFCIEARPKGAAPLGTEGHRETCDHLTLDEKKALIDYLRSL